VATSACRRARFEAVQPLVEEKDPKLVEQIEADFDDVYASLEPYRQGDGFVLYTELSKADTRKLAQKIDALAEELSQTPALIVAE
jgi:iron uptake system component EfeO